MSTQTLLLLPSLVRLERTKGTRVLGWAHLLDSDASLQEWVCVNITGLVGSVNMGCIEQNIFNSP